MKDTLARTAAFRKTIKTLVAYIRSMRAWITENDTLHQEREKELLHLVSARNRRIKKLETQVENYRSDKKLVHLEEVVKNQSIKIGEYIRIINQYELEKL